MELTTKIAEVREVLAGERGRVALVPTMGALHGGHAALIHRAKQLADRVVVSIFVNPAQFGPGEDLARYPRPVEADLALCRREGVDVVFKPEVDEMYPPTEPEMVMDVPALTGILEGAHRPGHFVGVCRVVAKLLNIVGPGVACFGMKDYQQLKVIESMVGALCMAVEIEACATVREADGLALSSRNVYLKAEERGRAVALYKALCEARRLIREGETDPRAVEAAMRQEMLLHHVEVEYAVVRDRQTLVEMDIVNTELEPVVCLVAGRVGSVRLIDNVVVE